MFKKSLSEDAEDIFRAIALIELGARMQVLETELPLSRDRMIRLYREVTGVSPSKGMLPSSSDWYMTWLANIHGSLFYNTYLFLKNEASCSHLDALTKGYQLYREHCKHVGIETVLDLTRAWTLVRFFNGGILQLTRCCRCTGKFIAYKYDSRKHAVCSAYQPHAPEGPRKRRSPGRGLRPLCRAASFIKRRFQKDLKGLLTSWTCCNGMVTPTCQRVGCSSVATSMRMAIFISTSSGPDFANLGVLR